MTIVTSSQFTPAVRLCPDVGLILGQRRGRWAKIKPALGQRLVFSARHRNIILFFLQTLSRADGALSVFASFEYQYLAICLAY